MMQAYRLALLLRVLRLKFPVELHDREDKKIEEAVLLMINPLRKHRLFPAKVAIPVER